MSTKTAAIAAALVLSLSGSAWAQTPAGGGSAEGNMNSPGSVKSNSEKGMERSTGSATGGSMGAGSVGAGSTTGSTSGHSGGGNMSTGGTAGGSAAGAR